MTPDLGDLMQIEIEILALHDREAFGIGLHHAVLDPVVDHLGEVTRAVGTDMAPALVGGRRQTLEQRPERFDGRRLAANHHAVAFLQAPDTTAGTDVDVMQVAFAQRLGPTHRVLVHRIAAIDDDVALRQQRFELADERIDQGAGRYHQPHDSGRGKGVDRRRQRVRRFDPLLCRLRHRFLAGIVPHHPVPAAHQALCHVGAHAPESHHCKIHTNSS